MKQKQYSLKQKAQILRAAKATSVARAAADHGVSVVSIYNWRKHPDLSGVTSVDAARVRKLEAENASVRKQLVELSQRLKDLSSIAQRAAAAASSNRRSAA